MVSIRLNSATDFECAPQHPQQVIVFTTSPDAPFSEYDIQNMPLKDSKLSIYFEAQQMMDDSLMLLRFNCPDQECPFIARGWNDLRTHVKVLHKKMMWSVILLLVSKHLFVTLFQVISASGSRKSLPTNILFTP